MIFLHEDFIYLASDAATAKDALKPVTNHPDLRNSSTLYLTVPGFFTSTMQDTDILADYICSYEQKHPYSTERYRSANYNSLNRHLYAYRMSDETKARHP